MDKTICLQEISKSYQGRVVLDHVSLQLPYGSRNCIMGPSGTGKTTLLRLILGLEKPDQGQIRNICRMSAVFQENRLVEEVSAFSNVRMVLPGNYPEMWIREALCQVLPEESLTKPAASLSGGMKRRVAVVRALLAESDAVILDEPFTGLDERNREVAAAFIDKELHGRTLLLVTHDEKEAEMLSAAICFLTTESPIATM